MTKYMNSLEESVQHSGMHSKSGETLVGSIIWLAGNVITIANSAMAGYGLGSGNPEVKSNIQLHPLLFTSKMAIGPGIATLGGYAGSLPGAKVSLAGSAFLGVISFGIGYGIGYFSR